MKGKAKVVKCRIWASGLFLNKAEKFSGDSGGGGRGDKEKAEKADIALSSEMPCPLTPEEDLILRLDQAMPLLTFRNLECFHFEFNILIILYWALTLHLDKHEFLWLVIAVVNYCHY